MPDALTYTATLPVARATVDHLAALLAGHRVVIGTRERRRSLDCFAQAVAFLRWMLDATKIDHLADDNAIALSTWEHLPLAGDHRYISEALDVAAAQAPTCTKPLKRPGIPATGT